MKELDSKELEKLTLNHWKYSSGIIEISLGADVSFDRVVELCQYFYIKAFKHGFKHCLDGLPHCIGGLNETCYGSHVDAVEDCLYIPLCRKLEGLK